MGSVTFQFPSSGKGCSKYSIPTNVLRSGMSFNSLQAGRGVQRLREIDPNEIKNRIVSIPFKREGVFKVGLSRYRRHLKERFNSLQAGRGVQRQGGSTRSQRRKKRFNSLQAGRGVQSNYYRKTMMATKFSFNSLQAGRGVQSDASRVERIFGQSQCFNSLQAGRGVQSQNQLQQSLNCVKRVSIPFKREGVFKVTSRKRSPITIALFQFPSSGKGCSKKFTLITEAAIDACFNSLQAGRGVQSCLYD